ncbi:hypothetical protein E2C01_045266 [Portunus trituberculatus]|uniref:Uncharacterized protein n=1 Tax=Portunus trituberculatus TaxID=210409 RepID=A0A5B7FVA4_PORTR|nr:hypothetical protein [Portunus trituberculatus]
MTGATEISPRIGRATGERGDGPPGARVPRLAQEPHPLPDHSSCRPGLPLGGLRGYAPHPPASENYRVEETYQNHLIIKLAVVSHEGQLSYSFWARISQTVRLVLQR